MEVFRSVADLRAAILERRRAGDSVGFIPTMGVLHGGQLSLVRRARAADGCVVVSCLGAQGASGLLDEGFARPHDEGRDLALLAQEGTDLVFVPAGDELYAPAHTTRVRVEGLTSHLEGASRPGHLDGLTTVMLKLVHIVGPAHLYLGQKHAQQVVILRRMLRDLFINVELVVCPTVREADGLALSSANAELSIEQRHAATCLFAALEAARVAYEAGERSAEVLRARMADVMGAEPMARVDYISVADAMSMDELSRVSGPALAMVAAWFGRTRLADNMPLAWDVA